MGLGDDIFSSVAIAFAIATAPLWSSFMLSINPFQTSWPGGWIANYEKRRKANTTSRFSQLTVPIALIGIAWIVVAAFYSTCAIYLVLTGGWIFYATPLIVLFAGLFFSVAWQPLYFSDCAACKNITFTHIIAILCSVFLFVWLINDHLFYALCVLPFMIWNVLWAVKIYLEYSETQCGIVNQALKCST